MKCLSYLMDKGSHHVQVAICFADHLSVIGSNLRVRWTEDLASCATFSLQLHDFDAQGSLYRNLAIPLDLKSPRDMDVVLNCGHQLLIKLLLNFLWLFRDLLLTLVVSVFVWASCAKWEKAPEETKSTFSSPLLQGLLELVLFSKLAREFPCILNDFNLCPAF